LGNAVARFRSAEQTRHIQGAIVKGPLERLKYDLRRLWECPKCHRHARSEGSVTSQFCACETKQEGGKPIPMALVDDGPQRVDGKPLTHRTLMGGLPRIGIPSKEPLLAEVATEAPAALPPPTE
jgi:hypothetical protein